METPIKTALERAIDIAGGMTELARAIPVTGHATIYQWKKTRVPAEYCPRIEELTGVLCEDLRPDVGWGVLRKPQIGLHVKHPCKKPSAIGINLEKSDQERRDQERRDAERRDSERRGATESVVHQSSTGTR